MREFRVWCKDKNEWEKDSCVLTETGRLLQYKRGMWLPCKLGTHVVQFYIGLKDKNNKKIFEGDILKGGDIVRFGYQEEVFNGFISVGGGEEDNEYISVCGVYLEDEYGNYKTLSDYLDTYTILKVIGNIYENLELLEKK